MFDKADEQNDSTFFCLMPNYCLDSVVEEQEMLYVCTCRAGEWVAQANVKYSLCYDGWCLRSSEGQRMEEPLTVQQAEDHGFILHVHRLDLSCSNVSKNSTWKKWKKRLDWNQNLKSAFKLCTAAKTHSFPPEQVAHGVWLIFWEHEFLRGAGRPWICKDKPAGLLFIILYLICSMYFISHILPQAHSWHIRDSHRRRFSEQWTIFSECEEYFNNLAQWIPNPGVAEDLQAVSPRIDFAFSFGPSAVFVQTNAKIMHCCKV